MFMECALLICLSVKGFFCNEIILSRGSEHPHYVNDYTAKCIYHNNVCIKVYVNHCFCGDIL